ncbi:VOC family protein [Granulicatella seriolae]|uniref:VOC family protein n=1 Tax=Granulicatella seriolae TaxID=2967226 RepID=A0ABT1WQG4_9LACT|nr:VOC family protein [Granulicatella seriolae]
MRIEHIAIWVKDVELMRKFYETYFEVTTSAFYQNKKTGFNSYFLEFGKGSRIELCNKKHLSSRIADSLGYTHIAISVGNKEDVDALTDKLINDGFPLVSGSRTTGDGYYESVIQDPEGNLIELTTD